MCSRKLGHGGFWEPRWSSRVQNMCLRPPPSAPSVLPEATIERASLRQQAWDCFEPWLAAGCSRACMVRAGSSTSSQARELDSAQLPASQHTRASHLSARMAGVPAVPAWCLQGSGEGKELRPTSSPGCRHVLYPERDAQRCWLVGCLAGDITLSLCVLSWMPCGWAATHGGHKS